MTKKTKIWISGIIILIIAGNFFSSYKIENIPQKLFTETAETSPYYKLLYGKKKITWFGPNCPQGQAVKTTIDLFIEKQQLNEDYAHYPFLVKSIITKDETERYFIEHCGNKFCITIPDTQKIIIVENYEKLFPTLKKFKNR